MTSLPVKKHNFILIVLALILLMMLYRYNLFSWSYQGDIRMSPWLNLTPNPNKKDSDNKVQQVIVKEPQLLLNAVESNALTYKSEDKKRDPLDWWNRVFPGDRRPQRKVKILVIVNSLPNIRQNRRMTIRNSWMKRCKRYQLVDCVFLIDADIPDTAYDTREILIEERTNNRDFEVMPFKPTEKTASRFIHQLKWAVKDYDFQYIMILSDDIFICFDQLIQDLKALPKTNVIWSRTKCDGPLVRPDGPMLISRDVVDLFLSQPANQMRCHPDPELQIALWVKDLKLRVGNQSSLGVFLSDNGRISLDAEAHHSCGQVLLKKLKNDNDFSSVWNNEQKLERLDTSKMYVSCLKDSKPIENSEAELVTCSSLGIEFR